MQHLATNYYALDNSGPGYGGAVEPGVTENWAVYWQVTTLPAGHKLGFEPIGPSATVSFRGVLDGNGHTITNLTIDRPETTYVGLFGYVRQGTAKVCNLTLAGSVVGNGSVGILSGIMIYGAIFSNVVVHANVRGNSPVAGLLGNADGAIVCCCQVYGQVAGNERVGSAIGYTHQKSRFENNVSRATVVRLAGSTKTSIGSFVGYNRNSTFRQNYALGPVHYEEATDPTGKGFAGATAYESTYYLDENNFFDTETTGQDSTAGKATGKPSAEMRDIATYTDLRTLGLGRTLSGTASAAASSSTVTGTNTLFTTELAPGQWIRLAQGIEEAVVHEVATILDDTSLTVTQPFDRTFSDVALYHVAPGDRWDMQAVKEDSNDGYPWLSRESPPVWSIYVYMPPRGSLILIH